MLWKSAHCRYIRSGGNSFQACQSVACYLVVLECDWSGDGSTFAYITVSKLAPKKRWIVVAEYHLWNHQLISCGLSTCLLLWQLVLATVPKSRVGSGSGSNRVPDRGNGLYHSKHPDCCNWAGCTN
jgi:hypothetical protein